MPFRMKNAPATFQFIINKVIAGLQGCGEYINDVVFNTESWEKYLDQMNQFFLRLREALNGQSSKIELGCARVVYLRRTCG